jgi:hypothetical protein
MDNKVVNDIRKIKLNQYVDFTNYLAEYLIAYPQVLSVYQMGGWTQPGISDIDLIVVVKQPINSHPKPLNLLNKALARNIDEEYMLMHAPFVISEEAFKNLNLFFYCSDLKRLKGKEISINKNPHDLQELAELYKLVSVLTHTYPRFFSFEKKKSLRSFLTFAYSLKHTYRIIREFDSSYTDNEIADYVLQMTNLRKKVIEETTLVETEVEDLIKLGIIVSVKMLKKVDMIIRNKVSFRPGKNDFLYVKNYENVFSYVQNSNSFKVQRKDGINLIELPHSFAIFNLMPSGNGILNRSQLKNIVGKNSIEVNEKEKKLLGQIEEPFEEYNLLFKKCKVFNGMSFELNTPFIWDNRKYRLFNLLDYARKTKHIILTKKRQLKVSQLINHYNS